MSHTNSTTNYGLPQFITTDKPAWLTDINTAFNAIDTGMKNNQNTASAAQSDATQALSDASSAGSTATSADAKGSGAIASIADNFNTTNTYTEGTLVMYNSLLYRCIIPVTTPGPWTGITNWERITINSLVGELDTKINNTVIKQYYTGTTTNYGNLYLGSEFDTTKYTIVSCTARNKSSTSTIYVALPYQNTVQYNDRIAGIHVVDIVNLESIGATTIEGYIWLAKVAE